MLLVGWAAIEWIAIIFEFHEVMRGSSCGIMAVEGVIMQARGCISRPEFEQAVKRVGEKPYSEIKARVRARAAEGIARLLATAQPDSPNTESSLTKRERQA